MCLQVKLFICDKYLKRFWTISGWVRLDLLGKEKKETYINWKNDKQNDFFSTPGILINYGTNMIYSQK